ncbi:uncharacterized protein [Amphiura filiformis]|uniref:uncharacterized protein isoform X2 n=1 Tax=Amphiura filiformis TaxID=82378 RepID=UPI003B2289A2
MTWCLVGNTGALYMLENNMMFVGRENCEISIQSRSVDKRHSVLNYDQIDEVFSIKDMSTVNGTFVNDTRIPDQTYINLQQGDAIRFGYDPVTYRFDQVDPTQIRQVKDALGVTRLEYKVEQNGNSKPEDKEVVDSAATEGEDAYLERPTTVKKQYLSTDSAGPTDNGRHTHKHKSDMIPSPRGSPLYGQPEWWGEPDADAEDEDEGFRLRSGTYDAPEKDKRNNQESSHTQRPTKLALAGDNTRDIPVHIYTRRTDIKPTTPNKHAEPPDQGDVTLVKTSEKHVGFTIEFNAKADSPKMSRKESLQDFVPVTLKNRINENSRVVGELKAERLSKKGGDPDSLKSPIESPQQPKKHGRRRSGSNETPANRNKANQSASKTSHRKQSDNMIEDGDGGGDNVSETGTYTIESESQDVLEARHRIDEVFGVNGNVDDGERGSEEDTDKDISDEEIVEEAISKDILNAEHAGYHRKGHGHTPDMDYSGNMYVGQWAKDAGKMEETVEDSSGTTPSNSTVIKNDRSPAEKDPTSPIKTPTHATSNRRSGKGRRMLPTTPVERQEQGDSPRQNGLQSHGSAFHSPRDGDEEEEHEEPVRDNHVSPRNGGVKYTPRRNPMASGLHQPRPPMEPRNSWEQDGTPDTEILLKDTETFMRSLEEKMKTKTRESPSPEPDVSEALSHRDFDGDIDTDLESVSNVGVSGKGLYAKRGSNGNAHKRTSIPTKSEPKSEQSDSKGKSGKPEQPRKSTIWSRLSTPNKHKRTSDKDSSLMSDNQSESENAAAFQRNTSLTASLPVGRTGRKTPLKELSSSSKKESKKENAKSKPKTPKADLSKPRQTRSTMLRKSRFGDKDQDQSDISPTSSISDLSSSKPASFKKYGSSRETNKSSSKAARSKPVQSKVDYGRARTGTGTSGRTSGTDTSSQFTRNNLRSQSVREGRAHAGESSSRVMSKIASSKQSSSSRRSSVSSTDGTPASNVRKTSSSSWRKYKGESDNDDVDAYIQSVSSRRTASSSSYDDNKVKSSSMHNLTNHKGQPQQQASVQAAGKLGDEIAHVSSSLAQSLQRLTKMTQGESGAEAALESLPKEELLFVFVKVMDELFSEDAVFIPKSQSQTNATVAPLGDDSGSRLQRASSLSLYPDENIGQALPTHQITGGSPPVALKHKHWGKTNESFDNLVLSSVNHLSLKLKDSSDRIAYKLKYLQCPNASEDELAEAVRESEFALLKTGNAEIASILRNMRQMEKRLADIHAMIDPRNEIQLPRELSPAAQIRRKYIGEYSNLAAPVGNHSNSVGLKSPSATHPRRAWPLKSPTSGGRSVFSDGEDGEVYL